MEFVFIRIFFRKFSALSYFFSLSIYSCLTYFIQTAQRVTFFPEYPSADSVLKIFGPPGHKRVRLQMAEGTVLTDISAPSFNIRPDILLP